MAGKYDGAIYIDTAIETDGFVAGGKEVEAAARRMAKSVSGIGETAKIALQKQTDAFVKQNQQYAQQRQKVESLKEELKELSETKVETKEFAEIGKQITNDTIKLNKLLDTQEEFLAVGGKESSSAYQKRELQIEKLRNSIEHAKAEQDDLLSSGKAYTTPDTSGVQQKLAAEQQKLVQMNNALGTSYESLKAKVQSYGGEVQEEVPYTNMLQSALWGLKTAVHAPISVLKLLGKGILSLPTKIPELLANGLKKLGSAAKKAAIFVGKTLLNGLKRVSATMLGLNKQSKGTSFGIKQALKSMLMYGIIGNIFRSISNGAKEGMQNLAQYSGETNASISSLMSALTQLKNSFSTAFAPILNVVAPILTTFINLVSQAVTYVGMLIAALTGKGTFTKAVGVQQDYAASLNDSASAAENAKDASEDYLSGLDEVKKFETNDSSSGGSGGGGGGGVSPGEMFETVSIGDQFKNWADQLKEMWEKADFTELGTIIGTKLKDALDGIDLEPAKSAAEKIGKSIATFINGFVEVEGLSYSIGEKLGNAINIGIAGINSFLDNTRWSSVGSFIGNGLNGVVGTVDWSGIGHLLAEKSNAILATIGEAARSFKWVEFGKNLASSLNTWISDFNWAENGKNLSDLIKRLLDALITIVKETNWNELGENVAAFLGAIDWAGIASRLFTALGAAFGGIGAFIVGLLGDALSGFYEKYIEPYIPDVNASGEEIVAGFLMGIGAAIVDIAKWIYDNIFKPFIDGFCEAFDIHSPSKVMEEQGGFIIEGVLEGLKGKVGDVIQWFKDLPDEIRKALGNAKEWLKEKGEDAIEGIKKGWEAVKDSKLLSKARKLKDDVFDSVGAIAEKVKTKGSDIISGIKTGYENSKESGLLSKVRRIGTEAFSAVGNIGQTVKSKGSDIISGLNEGYESKKQSGFLSGVDKIRNQVTSAIGNISQVTRAKGADIVSGLSDGLTSTFGKFTDIVSSIPWHIMNAIGDLYSVGKNALQNFINGFTSLNIPVPHINIGWESYDVGGKSFSLPKFKGISWYGSGGFFRSPSIIGVGEAGDEAVLPIQNRKVMSRLANSIVSSLGNRFARMRMPYLATGAVIPPNAPFTAVLGDQKSGTNIETPEKLLRQLFREEFSRVNQKGRNYTFIGQINRRTLFEEMMTEAELVRSQTGMNPFEMA